jgi:hypothetical protein
LPSGTRSSIRRVVANSPSRSGKSRASGLWTFDPAADLFAGFRADLFGDFFADLLDDFLPDFLEAFDDFERADFLAINEFK